MILYGQRKKQLKNFDYHKKRRQELANFYVKYLREIPSIQIFDHNYDNVVPHIFVILLNEKTDRVRLIKFLDKNGIPAGVHYKPNHRLTFFSSPYGNTLPVTDMVYPRLLTLPLHPELDENSVKRIVSVLKKGLQGLDK